MKKCFTAVIAIALLCCFSSAHARDTRSGPRLNDGKSWRIAYYEGGAYSDYTETMRTLVNGLAELGWIEHDSPPQLHGEQEKPYLEWLQDNSGTFLSFTEEDSYSAGWDSERRAEMRDELLGKLVRHDIDLVLAMGTWAGLDLATNDHNVPVIVLSTSNPIHAGIISGADDSGLDHVTARVDPNRYLRQMRMFHRIVGFKRLGVAYENTADGRIYSAIRDVRQIAAERDFDLITCEVNDTTPDTEVSDQSCMDCYRQLSSETDAVYVTALTCVDRKSEAIADIFKQGGVPSFSLTGAKMVKQGILLSITDDSGYEELGQYNAGKLGRILNGARPRDLEQVFEDPLSIAINMGTAKDIGFVMPPSIVKIADRIYED